MWESILNFFNGLIANYSVEMASIFAILGAAWAALVKYVFTCPNC